MGSHPVVLLSHRADRTGAPLCMLDLLRYGDRQRFPARVLLGEEGPLIDDLEAAGATVDILPRKQARGRGRILSLRRALSVLEPRLVHLNSAVGFTKSGALAARSLGLPVLWHLHDDFANPKFGRRRSWVRWLSHSIVACSHSIAARIPSSKTVVVENGVRLPRLPSPAERQAARQKLGLPADARVIAFVGTFTPGKNPLLIAGAAERLLRTRTDLHFLLVGGGDKARYRAQVEARASGVVGLSLHRELACIDVVYQAADLVLLPSTVECRPRVLLEAAAWGLPTVATPVGDVPSMIEDGVSGWVVPIPQDERQLERALEPVLDASAEEWARRGARARRDLAENYGMERYVAGIEAQWSALLGEIAHEDGV